MTLPLESLTASAFQPLLGASFTFAAGDVRAVVTLTAVRELDEPAAQAQGYGQRARRPFTLHFVMPGAVRAVPQQICTIEHPAMGALDIFLVPLGPTPDGMRYEAIFS